MSQEAGASRIPIFFVFFSETDYMTRQPGEVHTILTGVPISSCAPSSSHQWVPGASPSTPTDFGIRIRTHYNELKCLTNITTKKSGWWYFMSQCVYILPRMSQDFKEFQIFKFSILRRSGIELMTSRFSVSPTTYTTGLLNSVQIW